MVASQNWTAKAEEFCARVENPRPVNTVERDLNSVQKALKEREKKSVALCLSKYTRYRFGLTDVAISGMGRQ